MNRHSKILLGPAKSTCPQTLDRLATADILPGTLVNIASDKFAAIAAANSKAGVQLYVASENFQSVPKIAKLGIKESEHTWLIQA